MSDNVVYLDNETTLDIPPARVLEDAAKANLTHAVILGYTEDELFYYNTSTPSGPEVLWMLALAVQHLLRDDE